MNNTSQEVTQENKEEVKYPIINLEETDFCQLKVHYEADPDVVKNKFDEAITELLKAANPKKNDKKAIALKVPGFRPGRVPDYAIKTRLKPQIYQYVAREMATHAIDDIVFEHDIKPIGLPQFSNVVVKDEIFSCDIGLNKRPEFELGQIKFEIPKPNIETDEEALAEKSLFNLRVRVGEALPYEESDVVEPNDQVTFSFNGSIDGTPFDGSVVEGELYTIGSNRWKGFDDQLLGMKSDETREFDFTFTDGPTDLVGKTAHFSVTVHMGMKVKPHPLNEEFYKKMGVENVEDLMDKLRTISKTSIEKSRNEAIRSQVGIKLLESNKFDVPRFLVEAEAKQIAPQIGLKFDSNLSEEDRKKIWEQADRNIRLSLILDAIRESEPDAVLNDTEAQNYLAQHFQTQGQDPNKVFNNKALKPQVISLLNSVKDEFVLQWVANQATIIE